MESNLGRTDTFDTSSHMDLSSLLTVKEDPLKDAVKLTKLNIGCGETKLPGFINLDFEAAAQPDVVCNFKLANLPFDSESFEVVHMLHCLEHIEMKYWDHVFFELRRVMKDEGVLYLAYPEFEVASKYFIENHQNRREFWRMVLYGRQLYPGDYHVVPMRTVEIVNYLEIYGFNKIRSTPENEEWNTFLACKKGPLPPSREDILRLEIFNGKRKIEKE